MERKELLKRRNFLRVIAFGGMLFALSELAEAFRPRSFWDDQLVEQQIIIELPPPAELTQSFPQSFQDELLEPTIEEKIEQYKIELQETVAQSFSKNKGKIQGLRENGSFVRLDLLSMYYPIYRVAQDRFDVPWYLLWVIHDDESTCSIDTDAFIKGREHYGAMQRSVMTYPQALVNEIAFGFEYLSTLPQNHKDDWEEILWAASKISKDTEAAIKESPNKTWEWGLEDAVRAYSALAHAVNRVARAKVLRDIFS